MTIIMKALILHLTEDSINCDKTNIREQIEDILDDPNNVEFKEFTNETSMLGMIHSTLKLGTRNIGVTARNIYETKYFLYIGYFIDMSELLDYSTITDTDESVMIKNIKVQQKNLKNNAFGSQITSEHVMSDLIIVKHRLSYTITGTNIKTESTPISINSQNEMIRVFESLFVKTGVVIKTDGSINTYSYIMNPIEHLMLTDPDYSKNYVYHEYEVYTYVMTIIADTREVDGILNHTATLLAGKPVNGDVFVAIYRKPDFNENPPYMNLSINTITDILNIRQRSASLTTGMSTTDKEYINFKKLLELEKLKHKDVPILVATDIKGELLNHR